MEEQTHRWVDRRALKQHDNRTHGVDKLAMDRRMKKQTDGWMDGQMDRKTYGRTDGQTDGRSNQWILS